MQIAVRDRAHYFFFYFAVALGSSVQIALFVLPLVVVVGWFTGKNMTLMYPSFEVYLYLISVVLVSLCLSTQRSNWLTGSLLISTYVLVAVGIYFEEDISEVTGNSVSP